MKRLVILVEFTIDVAQRDEFIHLVCRNAEASLAAEPGCSRFDVCVDDTRPECVVLYEIYTDDSAFDAHLSSAHFREFDAMSRPMVRDKNVQRLRLTSADLSSASRTRREAALNSGASDKP